MADSLPLDAHDPALAEAARAGDADDQIAVIVRLTAANVLPPDVLVVSRFGDIATVRVARSRVAELADSVSVVTVEAPRRLRTTHCGCGCQKAAANVAGRTAVRGDHGDRQEDEDDGPTPSTRRPEGVTATGKGVVVGVLDFGIDFAHPAFRNEDGSTRIRMLWDQRGGDSSAPANRWGYGRVYTEREINASLATSDPYRSLNYDPSDSDEGGEGGWSGAHGTHVLDIIAGSGRGGGATGVAPGADLMVVHLSRTTSVLGEGNLGDSAAVLEGLDAIFSAAGSQPVVVNMSLGAHGGPHDGTTLVEQGIDQAVWLSPNRAVVNSAGNYFARDAHAEGRLQQGERAELRFNVPPDDPTDSEIELYYESSDRFSIEVIDPTGTPVAVVRPGDDRSIDVGGRTTGHIYHRVREATSGDHHIDLFLRKRTPAGVWTLRLTGDQVQDGRYHAWIERDHGLSPRFIAPAAVTNSTTGTLCNGRFSITVGAHDPSQPHWPLGPFSSAGPTRDGRSKPEIVAPGVRILAARSTPRGEPPAGRYVRKSGTSMAAPHVTGTIALMFEAAAAPLSITDTRALLFASTRRLAPEGAAAPDDVHRIGYGYLDISAAERAAREWGRDHAARPPDERSAETQTIGAESADSVRVPAEEIESVAEEAWTPRHEEMGMDDDLDDLFDDVRDPSDSFDLGDALRDLASESEDFDSPFVLIQAALSLLGSDAAGLSLLVDAAGFLQGSIGPGDVLLRAAPFEGVWHAGVVVSDDIESARDLIERGLPVEDAGPGGYVEVLEVPTSRGAPRLVGRRLTDAWGRVARGQTLARAAGQPSPLSEADLIVDQPSGCSPAAVPDPQRDGLHPLVKSGMKTASVGRAQELLNLFLGSSGLPAGCPNTALTTADKTFITTGLATLTSNGQNPLVVDCRFSASTKLAVEMFQVCVGVAKTGKVDPDTWPFLELLSSPPNPGFKPRICCLLLPGGNILDPSGVGAHSFGIPGTNGILYCGKAGFVDLGHTRDVIDTTKFIHDQLTAAGGPPKVIRTLLGIVSIRRTPADPLETAAAIAYDDAFGHEIVSWDTLLPGGRNSSFSPEDLVSNFLGTVVARRAIARVAASGGTFDAAATTELDALLVSLDVQTQAESEKSFNLIKQRWVDFTGSAASAAFDNKYLRRRNFTRTPFKTGHSSDKATPAFVTAAFKSSALADYDYFHLEGFKVLPRKKFAAGVKRVQTEAKAEFGPDFDKP